MADDGTEIASWDPGSSVGQGGARIYQPGAAATPNPYLMGPPGSGSGAGGSLEQQGWGGLSSVRSNGYGAGGGANTGLLSQLLQKSWQQAQQANNAQFGKMLGLASQYGQSQIQQSNLATGQMQAQGQQQMANRGLYNSTVAQSVNQSAANLGQQRNAQIADNQTQLQLGVYGQNQIKYPDLGLYASLMSRPGATSNLGSLMNMSGGGGGGGGQRQAAAPQQPMSFSQTEAARARTPFPIGI